MDKIIFGMGIIAFGLLAFAMPVAAIQEVYLTPQHCNATYGDELEVEIWVTATDFKSGQINLTYDSGCANITGYVWNVTNFPLSGRLHDDGSEWITFMTSELTLAGNYQIGTLTLQCVNADTCGTRLHFEDSSTLFDSQGEELPTSWSDGNIDCNQQAYENTDNGDGADVGDATISSDENETEAPAPTVTPVPYTEPPQTPQDGAQEPDVSPSVSEPAHTQGVQTPSSSTEEQESMISGLVVVLFGLVFLAGVILGIMWTKLYKK